MSSQSKSMLAGGRSFVIKFRSQREFFHRTVGCFREEDALFKPAPDMFTVVGQVLHVTGGIEFFLSGLFGPFDGISPLSRRAKGFSDMEWTDISDVDPIYQTGVSSVADALASFDRAIRVACDRVIGLTAEQLAERVPPNPILHPAFTYADSLEMAIDHTAHHRGALAQYARILGRSPKIPYFDMDKADAQAIRILAAIIGE